MKSKKKPRRVVMGEGWPIMIHGDNGYSLELHRKYLDVRSMEFEIAVSKMLKNVPRKNRIRLVAEVLE